MPLLTFLATILDPRRPQGRLYDWEHRLLLILAPVGRHVVPREPTVHRRAIGAIERAPRSALETDVGAYRDPPRLRGVDPTAEVALSGSRCCWKSIDVFLNNFYTAFYIIENNK